MEIIVSDFISWQYFILLLLVILFFIWIFWGGGDYEYVGYAPLKIGVNAAEINTKKDEESEDNFSDIEYSQDISHDNFSQSQENSQETLNSDDSFKKVYLERSFKPTREKEKVTKLTYSCEIEQPKIKNLVKGEIGEIKGEIGEIGEIKEEKEKEKGEGKGNGEGEENGKELKSPRSLALGEFTCYGGNKMSKGEALCKKAIEDIYGLPFYCIRPNFLKNPETGRNLELDLYNDSLKIAVEYNGMQHSVFPNSFHKTYEEFINQVRRDQYKIDTCDKNGIYLITVPYTVPTEYEEIRKYIEYYLPENHGKRLEDFQK